MQLSLHAGLPGRGGQQGIEDGCGVAKPFLTHKEYDNRSNWDKECWQ
jgi:hypothetical protein